MRSLALFLLLGCSRPVAAPAGPTSVAPLPSSELAPSPSATPRTPTGETEVTMFDDGAARSVPANLSACRTEPMIGWVIYTMKIARNGHAVSSSIVERAGVSEAAAECVPPLLRFDPPDLEFPTYTVYVAFR